jgi:alkylation response protein AidB-like acyl-CoA dehydrogenase
MDFEYTSEQEQFREELQAWLEENLPDGWTEGDRGVPDDQDEREQFLRDWQARLYEGNWAGLHWPSEYGGRDASLLKQTVYREETAKYHTPQQVNAIGINFVGPTLMEEGTEEQKERYLPNMLNGEEVWCQGYSEPGAGSDIASLTTRAERDGDEFRINGQKIWTSYAHYSDWCFLVTRTDDSGVKHEGITTILVDMDQEGVSISPIHQASDEEGFNQMYFDDAVAPVENVVGEVGQGWDVVMTLSSFEHGTTRIFSIEQRFEDILEYCESHTRNGQPLVQDPVVRQELADLDSRIQAARVSHLRNVSQQMETGMPGPEGSMDLVVADELANDLENFAVNILGPEAALWEDGPDDGQWARDYLQTYGSWIAAGTGDIQRNIIGERVLGMPKDDKSQTSHREES